MVDYDFSEEKNVVFEAKAVPGINASFSSTLPTAVPPVASTLVEAKAIDEASAPEGTTGTLDDDDSVLEGAPDIESTTTHANAAQPMIIPPEEATPEDDAAAMVVTPA